MRRITEVRLAEDLSKASAVQSLPRRDGSSNEAERAAGRFNEDHNDGVDEGGTLFPGPMRGGASVLFRPVRSP